MGIEIVKLGYGLIVQNYISNLHPLEVVGS